MKRILWMVLLTLALPMAAFASNSVDFTNSGGTLSGSSAGLTLSGSELVAVNGLSGMGLVTGDLGSVAFSTGALLSGDLQKGGTFSGGGSFTVTGNGMNGIPSGAIFTGSFDGPVSWTLVTLANGTHNYTLSGFGDRDMDQRSDCLRRDRAADHQYGKGLLQRDNDHLQRRHQHLGSRARQPDSSRYRAGWPSRNPAPQTESINRFLPS